MALETVTFQSAVLATPAAGLEVAADILVGGEQVQYFKGVDGLHESESVVRALGAVPSAADVGWVTRQVGLPAAAAMADAEANPTLTEIVAFLKGYNGATWDRLRSSIANGLVVDVSRVQGSVTIDSELAAAAALADATANPTISSLAALGMLYNGTTWDRVRGTTNGQYVHGPVAHDAAAVGNPIRSGAKAKTSIGSAVSADDISDIYVDEYGRIHVVTGGIGANVGTNFTRPADTTAYAAGDAVTNSTSAPTVLTFTSMARLSGGAGEILGAILVDESNPGTPGVFRLHLYDTTYTPNNDNAANAQSTTIARTAIPPIAFVSNFQISTTARIYYAPGPFPFKCNASANLFGNLSTDNAYTPASSGRFDIILLVKQY